MKNAKIITLALLATAGGLIAAAAQSAGPFYSDNVSAMDYPLHVRFVNPLRFVYTAGLPTLTNTDLESLSEATYTDGSGRIDGLVYARVYFGGPNNHTNNYGAFTITAIGKTSNQGTNPLVKITLRGNGYDFDGLTNHPNATLSLTFTSTNKLADVPSTQVAINSTSYSVTFADGTTQVFTDGPATRTNSAYSFLSGRMKGNIKPGKKSPVNKGKSLTINENAALVSAGSVWTVVNGTNFIEQKLGGGLILNVLTNMDAQVIQPTLGSRLYLNAYIGNREELYTGSEDLYTGMGSVNTNKSTWSANFTAVAFARGSNLSATGTLGPAIFYETIPNSTDYQSIVLPYAIQSMNITGGRVYGQRVLPMQGLSLPPTPPSP
jgi:hypothetical protein